MRVRRAREGGASLALFHQRIVFAGVHQAIVGLVGGVALEHVEDEALLDGLAHAVDVERVRLAVGAEPAEDL